MIPQIDINFYNDSTISREILQTIFTELNTQVTGQTWISKAKAAAYYISGVFFYHNEHIPGTTIEDEPLQLSLQEEENMFTDKQSNIFSGPEGAIGCVIGIKPFRSISIYQIITKTLKRLFPNCIIGTDEDIIFFNSQVINAYLWADKGIATFRMASLTLPEDSSVSYEEMIEQITRDLVETLEYA